MARRPYTGRTTSAFGPRAAPISGASTLHQGVDGVGGYNTAPEGGGLVGYSYAGGWGNRIVFQGDSGTLHYLAHNAPNGLLVPVGKWYPEGTPLGIKGMTGTATGIHVHWETRPGGRSPIDPEVWLQSQNAPAGDKITPITERDESMQLIRDENGSFFLIGEYYAAPFSASDVVGRTAAAETFGSNVQVSNASAQNSIDSANTRRAQLIADIVRQIPQSSVSIDKNAINEAVSRAVSNLTVPTAAQIATETIRQMKLPGN